MLIKIKTTSFAIQESMRNPWKYKYTRHGVEDIYQTRCIEPTYVVRSHAIIGSQIVYAISI